MQKDKPVYILNRLTIGHDKGKKNQTVIHRDLSLELYRGQLTSLLGANGSGKSTLIKTMTQDIPSFDGEIMLDGKPLQEYSKKSLSEKISLVLTDRIFAGGLKVKELVAMGRYPYTGFWGKLNAEDDAVVELSMKQVGIAYKKDNFVAELSDGEKQKVLIAKALSQQTPMIILDEPTSFLDITSRIEIMALLQELAHKQNKAILLSTHDLEQALLMSDSLWLLDKNGNHHSGNPEDIMASGVFDHIFGSQDILFDSHTGQYTMRRDNAQGVNVRNENVVPGFWVNNLLSRYGFKQNILHQEGAIEMAIESINKISISKENNVKGFNSFSEVAQYLKQIAEE